MSKRQCDIKVFNYLIEKVTKNKDKKQVLC